MLGEKGMKGATAGSTMLIVLVRIAADRPTSPTFLSKVSYNRRWDPARTKSMTPEVVRTEDRSLMSNRQKT
jgi:hypothetical protein